LGPHEQQISDEAQRHREIIRLKILKVAPGQSAMARVAASRRSAGRSVRPAGAGQAAQTAAMAPTVKSRLSAPAVINARAALEAHVAGQSSSAGSGP